MRTNNQNLTHQCENKSQNSSSQLPSSQSHGAFSFPVRRNLSTILKKILHAHVVKDLRAGLVALAKSKAINSRLYAGVLMIGAAAPLSACSYMLFDRKEHVAGWYHVNLFYLFMLLGPYMFQMFCLIGTYHLFPQGARRSYLISIPLGFTLGKVIWLCQVSSNEEFYSILPSAFVFAGIFLSITIMVMLDFFAWRQFHAFDSIPKRMKGLIQMPGVSSEVKMGLLESEIEKLKKFHANY